MYNSVILMAVYIRKPVVGLGMKAVKLEGMVSIVFHLVVLDKCRGKDLLPSSM